MNRGVSDGLSFLAEDLDGLATANLLREPRIADAAGSLVLCSNDYLGLASEPLAPRDIGAGAGASALVAGYTEAHAAAEIAIASWIGAEASLLFSSGYAANLGTVAALVGKGDLVVSDALNHASIIDGSRLSGATIRVFPHRDTASLEALLREQRGSFRRCLLVTESYFSMDGTLADLRELRRVASRYRAILMVDEAHALGVYGPSGRGRSAFEDVTPDIYVGTLGKSFGLQGAFVAGSSLLRLYLWNRARSFVFSTAPSPALAAAIPARLERVAGAEAERVALHQLSSHLRTVLRAEGAALLGEGPIIPWILGTPARALAVQEALRDRGLWVAGIRPPTVPSGLARVRITPTSKLESQRARIEAALREVARGVAQ